MQGPWIAREELGRAGKNYLFDSLAIWSEPAKSFDIAIQLKKIEAEVFVLAKPQGFYVRGRIDGRYVLPCVRCLDWVAVECASNFELFEELGLSAERAVFVQNVAGDWALNIHAILWEQFVLELPQHVLCREDCQGLCPCCGVNLNKVSCDCAKQDIDPRLEVFRKLKL